MKQKDELVIRGPVLVPYGWLVAIIGASGTAILLAFSVGVWAASTSTRIEVLANATSAQGSEVAKLKDAQPEISVRLAKIETILTYAFPKEARKAEQ